MEMQKQELLNSTIDGLDGISFKEACEAGCDFHDFSVYAINIWTLLRMYAKGILKDTTDFDSKLVYELYNNLQHLFICNKETSQEDIKGIEHSKCCIFYGRRRVKIRKLQIFLLFLKWLQNS